MKQLTFLIIALPALFTAYKATAQNITTMNKDPHSCAQPDLAVITHLHLQLEVDFSQKILFGSAKYRIAQSGENPILYLDMRDIQIENVTANGAAIEFTVSAPNQILGSSLRIAIPQGVEEIEVHYRTSPVAAALQWLEPRQTLGGKLPFLFTQSQAILARTWIPIQDSPGIRFTYSATIKVPKGMLALMSAKNPKKVSPDGLYSFEMRQPVPAYLMALAVGDIEYCALGEKTGVYAEPALLSKAAWEFEETEKMLGAAEALYGPYRWEEYDLLVLPPSFPFGGMENPRLTFATPTILAGDRSLTSLVAHELAHSWSGNLVTNSTWNDFWLNEGFTVYFERRIMEALYGTDYADMLAALGYEDLRQTVDTLLAEGKAGDTHLKLQLEDRDPDDGMNDVAYEKGYFLLKLIEHHVGREPFDAFVKDWFSENSFQSRNTEDFIQFLKARLLSEAAYIDLRVETWIYSDGLPDNLPIPKGNLFERVDTAVKHWITNGTVGSEDTLAWSAHEWLRFVRELGSKVDSTQMAALDRQFSFTQTGNAEVKAAWLLAAIRNHYSTAYPALEDFLQTVGRRKFIVPLYKAMMQFGSAERAKSIYSKARPGYHAVAVETLDKIVR